jgi:hypothetical protein
MIVLLIIATVAAPIVAIVFASWWRDYRRRQRKLGDDLKEPVNATVAGARDHDQRQADKSITGYGHPGGGDADVRTDKG